jgi:sporulation protein YlmC with PRC-barrel domain
MSGSAIIGAKVRNANRDTVGTVDDVYLDPAGHVRTVVLSVGGFLGMGSKDVAVKWTDIKYGRDGTSIVLTTDLSKDALKSLPDYKYERRVPAGHEQATVPPSGKK